MTYATSVPVARLEFSEGFNFYGAGTALTVTATVNLSVPQATHTSTGETLTDGGLIPAQDVATFDVPRVTQRGWTTPTGSTLNGWTYDIAVTITATGQPTLLWRATVAPRGNKETITPGMGALTGEGAGGAVSVTEDPDVPGTALIGA